METCNGRYAHSLTNELARNDKELRHREHGGDIVNLNDMSAITSFITKSGVTLSNSSCQRVSRRVGVLTFRVWAGLKLKLHMRVTFRKPSKALI